MDRLMKAIGIIPLDWSYKTRCCGVSLGISQLPIALELSKKILRNAKGVGAEAMRAMVSGESRTAQIQKRYVHKDGHLVWVQLNVTLISDQAGKPLHFVTTIQDVSQQKQASKEFEVSRQRLMQAVENSKRLARASSFDETLRRKPIATG
jgi:hypothetical protein